MTTILKILTIRHQKTNSRFLCSTEKESESSKQKNQKFIIQPKPPKDILADPSIINLIRQTLATDKPATKC
jgi:hypothetical protein